MSTEHLLSKELDEERIGEISASNILRREESRKWYHSWAAALTIHCLIIALYTFLFLQVSNRLEAKYMNGPDLVFSPAHHVVKYERKLVDFDVESSNIYKGPASPELDQAWNDLFKYNNIRVSKAELDRMNITSVELADGSGDYLAALDVMHHLHCVKMIRQYIHPESYKLTKALKVDTKEHINHCLDAIRQELMCRGDVSLTTYEWLPDLQIPWAKLSYDHECINWESIQDWAKERTVDIFDPKILKHPTIGTVFPTK